MHYMLVIKCVGYNMHMHRSGLYRYHTHVLKGSGSGQWQFMTMQDFIASETAAQQQQH
jgi:hypothetical protein